MTVNDYLARRDANWMGGIYEFLGLKVGSIQQGMSVEDRQHAYGCDVTYATANQIELRLSSRSACLVPASPGTPAVRHGVDRRGRLDSDRRGAHSPRDRGRLAA